MFLTDMWAPDPNPTSPRRL